MVGEGTDETRRLLGKSDDMENSSESVESEDGSVISDTVTSKCILFKGIFLSILSGVLFTANNFIIKGFGVEASDAVLVRGVVQVSILFSFSCSKGFTVIPRDWRGFFLVVGQACFGGFSFIAALICVTFMPVSDALVVMFTDPVITIVLAAIFLGERITLLRVGNALLILVGVTLVCRPPFIFDQIDQGGSSEPMARIIVTSGNQNLSAPVGIDSFDNSDSLESSSWTREMSTWREHDHSYWIGFAFAVAATATGTFHNILVPSCGAVKSPVLVMWVGLAAIAISSVGAQFNSDAMIATGRILEVSGKMWGILFGLAISGMLAYLSLTRALQMVSPTLVSSLRSLEIVLAFVVEIIITSAIPPVLSFIGAGLVILGVSGITFEPHIYSLAAAFCHRRSPRNGYTEI